MISWGRLEDIGSRSILGVMCHTRTRRFGSPGTAKSLFLTKRSCLNKHSVRTGKQPSFLPIFSSLLYFNSLSWDHPTDQTQHARASRGATATQPLPTRCCSKAMGMYVLGRGRAKESGDLPPRHRCSSTLDTKSRPGFQLLRGDRFLSPICHAHGPQSTLLLQWTPCFLSCPCVEQGLKFQCPLGSRSFFPSLQRCSESLILHL